MILRYLSGWDWILVICCVILVAGGVYFDLRIPEYMSEITYLLQAGDSLDEISGYGLEMLACAFGSLVLALCSSALASRVSCNLCSTLRSRQFNSIKKWSKQDLDSFTIASLVTRSTNDVYHIQQFFGRAVTLVAKAPIMAIWAIFKISTSNFEWTIATIVAMLILVISISILTAKGIPFIKKMQWFIDAVNGRTKEELDGMRTIRAYNAEEYETTNFDDSSEKLLNNGVKAVRIMAPIWPISSSMMSFLTLAIYWIGAGLIMSAEGDTNTQMFLFSDMIVFTSYATMVLSSVMMAANIVREVPGVLVSSRRIQEVIEHDPQIKDGTLAKEDADVPGEVVFENVNFKYPGAERDVLRDVSFKIRPGETFAIIGPTASGKSTLVNLIPRMYDTTSGRVLVGGKDVRDYVKSQLNEMIGYVPQTAILFSGTVRDNVCYGSSKSRTDKNAMDAIRVAQLTDLLERMPEGLDSDISQHGWNLSGGQKQRMSIARAVCKQPQIYIFDDTFSALDSKTDQNLRKALMRETKEATKIIVAQRVGTILNADQIMVLDHGAVVGMGKHSELIETCELYREIAKSQLEDFDDGH